MVPQIFEVLDFLHLGIFLEAILLHVSKHIQAALILELRAQSFLSFPPHKKLLKRKCWATQQRERTQLPQRHLSPFMYSFQCLNLASDRCKPDLSLHRPCRARALWSLFWPFFPISELLLVHHRLTLESMYQTLPLQEANSLSGWCFSRTTEVYNKVTLEGICFWNYLAGLFTFCWVIQETTLANIQILPI